MLPSEFGYGSSGISDIGCQFPVRRLADHHEHTDASAHYGIALGRDVPYPLVMREHVPAPGAYRWYPLAVLSIIPEMVDVTLDLESRMPQDVWKDLRSEVAIGEQDHG
jgi:hypothetical protein